MERTRILGVLIGCLLLPAAGAVAQEPKQGTEGSAEAGLRQGIQKEWLNLAAFAVAKGAKSTAKMALTEAAEFDPDPVLYPRLRDQAAALAGTAPSAAVERKTRVSRKRVVALLNRLAALVVEDKQLPRMESYLWRALRLDPSNKSSIRVLRRFAKDAASKGDLARCRRMVAKGQEYDLAGVATKKYLPAEGVIGSRDMLLIKSPGHPMLAWLVLPPDWRPKGRWKLLVHVVDENCRFNEAVGLYRKLLKDHSYMVLIPASFSQAELMDFERFPYDIEVINTQLGSSLKGRLQFDVAGLKAILDQVRKRFLPEKMIHLTGHGSGGVLAHWWLHHHPDEIRAAAPASARYHELCFEGGTSPRAKGPWIRLLTAAKDPAAAKPLEAAATEATRELRSSGFQRVETKRVPIMPGASHLKEVLAFFAEMAKKPR